MTGVVLSPSSSPSSLSTHNEALFERHCSAKEEEVTYNCISRVTCRDRKAREKDGEHSLFLTLLRKSFFVACKGDKEGICLNMEIGRPTDVRHVAHVTFDRFAGFSGLPVEFELEVSRRAPSASATVFGVSTESMQMSYDSRGNSVPTILLVMQRRLYAQGGLKAEGIFRINAENSQEKYVRNHLNRGVIPEGSDVHCLAGLIKAWFRELPSGVLDSLFPKQIIHCKSEEDCMALVRLLPAAEAALLDWTINLMADVVQEEHLNKMDAHNIATVFAPNMTTMADRLTTYMYAVEVMNFLKMLVEKTLRQRQIAGLNPSPVCHTGPSGRKGHQNPSQMCSEDAAQANQEKKHLTLFK